MKRAMGDYDNLLAEIESQTTQLQSFYNISSEEISLQQTSLSQRMSLHDMITGARQRQMDFQLASRVATTVANAVAEALPKNLVAGFSCGGDMTSLARSGIMLAGSALSEALGRQAENESMKELGFQQQLEVLGEQTQIELAMLRNKREAESLVAQLESVIRNLSGAEMEVYTLQESVRQASGRYLAAIARGERLKEDRLRFRNQTASHVTEERYKDMAFRIFRNDALQKYRAQFDLAAKYVYLAAKAYDYETNLLSTEPISGEDFFSNIVRRRCIGQINGGMPMVGRGMADILARLNQNFVVLKGQLGFNNPQTETNRFSLRRQFMRIKHGLDSNTLWQENLEQMRVADLRDHDDFRNLCDPLRSIVDSDHAQPAIVIPFETTVTSGLNFFGWPLSGGDSYYSATNFATKIRSVGVWFSNYNNTAGSGGLVETPRIYLVPAGADVMRVPTVTECKTRQWLLTDQVLPIPFPLSASELGYNRNWLPLLATTIGGSDFGRGRRFGDFRAFHDGGSFNPGEVISNSRLIGRSVWNTRWLLIIPGINLHNDPEKGIDRFIYGTGNPGDGVTDVLIFFQTYAYTSG